MMRRMKKKVYTGARERERRTERRKKERKEPGRFLVTGASCMEINARSPRESEREIFSLVHVHARAYIYVSTHIRVCAYTYIYVRKRATGPLLYTRSLPIISG